MRIYRVQGPDGRVYKLEGPEGATEAQVFSALQEQLAAQPTRPDRTLTEALTRGASRGFERLKSTVGDVIPGMAASALGFDEYAKQQMAEAAESQRRLQEVNPAEFQSYKQITSPYEALKYATETIGEAAPDIATSLLPGGVGGVLGRRAAVSGARAVGPLLPAVEAAAGATGAARGQAIGVYLGSYAQTAPEIFQGIYQETGQLEPGVSALFGSASAALDAILPAQLLRSMSAPVKVGIVEKILERSGMEPSLLRKVISQIPGSAAKEGLTEGSQEAINIAAEKFVNENASLWGSKEWERMVESGVRGAVAGGAFGTVGSVAERSQERGEETRQAQAAADQAERARIAALPPEPPAPPPPTPPGAPESYALAVQEMERLKREPATPENKARIAELQDYTRQTTMDRLTAAREPLTDESKALREQMVSGAPVQGAFREMEGLPTREAPIEPSVSPDIQEILNQRTYIADQIKARKSGAEARPVALGNTVLNTDKELQTAYDALTARVNTEMEQQGKTAPTILTPEVLDRTGLPRQSGFYKKLVNKNLMTFPELDEVQQILAEVRANKSLSEDTKKALENIASQSFNVYGQQAEMFGPRGAIAAGVEEAAPPKPTAAALRIASLVKDKDLTDPAVVETIRDKLTDYANAPTRTPQAIDEVQAFLETLPAPTEVADVTTAIEPTEPVVAADKRRTKLAVDRGAVPTTVSEAPVAAGLGDTGAGTGDLNVGEKAQPRTLTDRQQRVAFGKALGAAQSYPGSLRGRMNLPAQTAAKNNNFAGVVSALEKSKNATVAEIARRAKGLRTKIKIDDTAGETYEGRSAFLDQMSIDGAKMHLDALEKIREFAPIVAQLPENAALPYEITNARIETLDNGKKYYSQLSLSDITKNNNSMFTPLGLPEGAKLRTKEDFEALADAFERTTKQIGEDKLRLTSTASAIQQGVAGQYDAGTDTISVPEYFAKDENVLAHEIVHAQVLNAVASPTKEQKPAVAQLNKLYAHVKEVVEQRVAADKNFRSPYGITSQQEFIAEGLSNPDFQYLLSRIRYENTTVWDKFVESIAKLLGLKNDNALTELLTVYSDLTKESKPQPKAQPKAKIEGTAVTKTKVAKAAKEPTPEEAYIPEGKIDFRDAIGRLVFGGIKRADATQYVNSISDIFGNVDIADVEAQLAEVPGKVKYREGAAGKRGMTQAAVQAIANQVKATWKNAPTTVVVQSVSDLPQELREQIVRDKVNPPGAYDPNNKTVYLIADNIVDANDAILTQVHESLGHFGIQSILGNTYESVMDEIYAGNVEVRKSASKKMAEGLDKHTSVEEVLAEMAEKGIYNTAVQRIFNAIRQFLRKLGVPMSKVTDTEVRELLANAQRFVYAGGPVREGVTAFKGKALYRTNINSVGSTARAQPPYSNNFMEEAKNAASKLPGSLQEAFFGFWTLPQLAQTYGSELPSLDALDKSLGQRASTLSTRREKIAKNIDTWYKVANKHKALLPKFFDIANETTLTQVDPLDPANANLPLTKQFKQLPQDLQDVYKGLRKEYDTYSKLFVDELTKNLSGTAASKMRAEFESQRLKVYLPLRRFGEYWATYKDKSGERVSVAFDSPRERNIAMEAAKKDGGTGFLEHARLSQINYRQAPPTGFMGRVVLQLKQAGVEDEVINGVYQSYMTLFPAESLRQQFRPRKGTLGYEADVFQAYADVAGKMANQLTNMEYAKDIDAAVSGIRTEATDTPSTAIKNVVANVDKQIDFIHNPVNNRLAREASYASYIMYIAGNISSALVNLTQLPIVVYPMLAGKYGVSATTAAMQRATSMYFKGGKDTNSTFLPDHTFGANAKGEHKRLYDEAVNRSIIRRSTGYEITEARKSKVDSYTGLRAKVEHGLGWIFQNSERANREITLIAAFDLARAKGKSVDAAIEEAISLVNDAHGAALAETGPRFFQTGIGKVAFTFKRFAQSQIYLLSRLFNEAFRGADQVTRDTARKQLLGIAGMSYMFAGVQGMPLYGAASLLAEMLMGDDDEPFDADASVRAAIGDLGYKGPVNQLLNVDIASRTGFNGLLWRDDPKRLSEVGPMLYALEQAAGPVYGLARSAERGVKLINEGQMERGLEALSPSFVRNGMKAFRLGTEGALTKDGVPIVDDVSAYNAFMQVFGFNPAELAEAQARAGAEKTAEKTILNRRVALLDKIDAARMSGDPDGLEEVMESVATFNEKNPGVAIRAETIGRSFKERRRREQEMVDGVSLNRKMRVQLMEEYGQ